MKRRVRKIANFFAFNLLFFALYLNFIHKDNVALPVEQPSAQHTPAFSGTVLVDNPTKTEDKKVEPTAALQQTNTEKLTENSVALKLSIN
jgi:hypothetical protein